MEGRDSEAALPPDYQNPAELILGRLMYPSAGRGGRGGGNWLNGGTNWTVDYPRGDRTFAVAIRRLTRIDVRSVEQPVNPDDENDLIGAIRIAVAEHRPEVHHLILVDREPGGEDRIVVGHLRDFAFGENLLRHAGMAGLSARDAAEMRPWSSRMARQWGSAHHGRDQLR